VRHYIHHCCQQNTVTPLFAGKRARKVKPFNWPKLRFTFYFFRSAVGNMHIVPRWASNPDTWTGFEILFSCLTRFPFPPRPSKLLSVPQTVSLTLTLVVSFEPSTSNSWAGQCRAAATRLIIFDYYMCVHEFEVLRERVRSTYVYSGVKKSLVYPERFVNKGLIY